MGFSILFDNSDRRLNTDFNEVEIKRTIYKTGENEYFINNETLPQEYKYDSKKLLEDLENL